MANDNFFPGQMPGQPLGTGEGESPLAKPAVPNMDVRTMTSDVQSINTGSPAPKPYAPQASTPENIPVAPASSQPFQIPQMDAIISQLQPGSSAPKKGKGVFAVLIAIIAVAGLAALGYFVIYPIFFAAPAQNLPVTNPEVSLPAPEQVQPTEATSSAASSTSPSTTPSHVSVFSIPTNETIEVSSVITGASLSGLNIGATSTPNLAEIVYKDQDGNLVKFADILKATLNVDISSTLLSSAFNDQKTAGLVYTDAKGVHWLGFVAELNGGQDSAAISAEFKSAFESATDYDNLFVGATGAANTWKSSQVAGTTDHRYLTFANAEFAIDYGWVGNKLIIMTSFNGFKEALSRI
jgi:hypothetical protein